MSLTQAAQQFADALLEDDPAALYDRAPCGYLSTLPDGSVVKANSTFLTLTGYTSADVLTARFADLLTPGGRIFHETHVQPRLRLQDSVREVALDLLRKDGTRLPVLFNASVDRDAHGAPRIIRIAVFEATERRRYEQDLLLATRRAEEALQTAEAATRRLASLLTTLQDSLVPSQLPHVEGLELAGAYRPAGTGDEVGGDFYDAFTVGGDCWLLLGDVSGKGVEAASVTALIRNGTRAMVLSLLEWRREPAEILAMLDKLVEHHDTERFCTATVIRLRPEAAGWRMSHASGGHPPVLLVDADGHSDLIETSGPLLGLGLEGSFEQRERDLHQGQTLMLYTDGITEARRGQELYGDLRLIEVTSGTGTTSSSTALVETVLHDVLEFSDDLPRDDIACLAITVR